MSRRWHSSEIPLTGPGSDKPVQILADGAIVTTSIGDGRLIPLLILDTTERPDIEDLVSSHEHLPPGDATSQWGRLQWTKKRIILALSFKRPSKVLIILEFNVSDQGFLVETILTAKAVYLQPGSKGDRLSKTLDKPRIFVEIPDLGFREEWDKIWLKAVAKNLKKLGLSGKEAKQGRQAVISQLREIAAIRMRRKRK